MRACIRLVAMTWFFIFHFGANAMTDTCAVNDVCETATEILIVYSDWAFVCIESCNTGATPELFDNGCSIGFFPTTWFKVIPDGSATLMNIRVRSDDIDAMAITLFWAADDCSNLIPVALTASNLSCVVGNNGEAEAIGTEVYASEVYYIAVSGLNNQTGDFELCVNTISEGSACVTRRDIEITARSAGGSLEGPFYPGETVSICMNVHSFTAANNGCQWFQGLIPVFGNGWHPASFDPNGQPLNATLNGNNIGVQSNGLYGTATWDWFSDVDYHWDNIFLQPGDFDGNGTYEMCNILYEADCPNTGGLTASCCGPCWGAPLGTILPPGWYAYGINGTCPTPGPPIRVDWGDGNTCGGGMGPWKFCFDLNVRDYPDCLEDETTSDLSLGFFTTADGETGSWTGNASVCALDQPAKISLPMQCRVEINLGTVVEVPICSGDVLVYTIEHPDVDEWNWSITPNGFVQQPVYAGENGYQINHVVTNNTNQPQTITYFFTGRIDNSEDVYYKQMRFTVYPQIQFTMPDRKLCERDTQLLLAPNITGGTGNYLFQWLPTAEATPFITLHNPFPPQVILRVFDEVGCEWTDTMLIKTRPCHLVGTNPPIDDDNEPDHPKEPPPPKEDLMNPSHSWRNHATSNDFHPQPVPANDKMSITMQPDTCSFNDICETATEISMLGSDNGFVCISACNTGAQPELIANSCYLGDLPTTWFTFTTDEYATVLNMQVYSDFIAPAVSLFKSVQGCDSLLAVPMTSSLLNCISGSEHEVEAIGTRIEGITTYYLAVTSQTGHTDDFEVCLNTVSTSSICVLDRNIEITYRTGGGPLDGPFEPGETIGICLNVNSFSAINFQCPWLKGVVPVFGNGWDPASFTADGQPVYATLNDYPVGSSVDGLYAGDWNWYTDVDYHYRNYDYRVRDMDNNGRLDLCDTRYDIDCYGENMVEACCGPCWGEIGTLLPGGWFVRGAGSCDTSYHPVSRSLGDGKSCIDGMGPWRFCFELKTREYPACLQDHTSTDLSIGFFTFADDQVGSWNTTESVCRYDQPAKLTIPMICSNFIEEDTEFLPGLCSGDTMHYTIDVPYTTDWEWEIRPSGYVQQPVYEGPNGYHLQYVVTNETMEPKTIRMTFTGNLVNNNYKIVKEVRFIVYPQIQIDLPDRIVCERDSSLLLAPSIAGGSGNYHFNWLSTGSNTPSITLHNPFLPEVILVVNDEVGCMQTDTMKIRTRPCQLDDDTPPTDDDNEPDHPKDPPPPQEDFSTPGTALEYRDVTSIDFTMRPIPAKERVLIMVDRDMHDTDRFVITDINGIPMAVLGKSDFPGNRISLDVSAWPDGLYIATWMTGTEMLSRRMIKM
jgi:hypothetical protein